MDWRVKIMVRVTTTRQSMELVYDAALAKLLLEYDQSLFDGLVDIRFYLGMSKYIPDAENYLNNLILESRL
jgi:hypothetical protein